MFFDTLTGEIPPDLSYDICIVGAGAAGIALALEFAQETGIRICVLEGGGLEYDTDSQDLYRGEIVGRDYDDLDTCRLRYFGGTTNHWAGYCLPLSRNSFERLPWIPDSGWPITRQDVTPYYERAHTLLGLPPAKAIGLRTVAGRLTGSRPTTVLPDFRTASNTSTRTH